MQEVVGDRVDTDDFCRGAKLALDTIRHGQDISHTDPGVALLLF